MRLRKIKNAKERLEDILYVILSPDKYQGKWHTLFKNNQPLWLEIGMGKGKFIYEHAKNNPNNNYIGLEREASIIWKATEKINNPLPNLKFVQGDANIIDSYFDENEVAQIFLNFSDPWPKARHAKRRLTYVSFLDKYRKCLQSSGSIFLKTDNLELFAFSLEQFKEKKWQEKELSYHLHQDKKDIITTEYEDRFSALGNPIYYVEVQNGKNEII